MRFIASSDFTSLVRRCPSISGISISVMTQCTFSLTVPSFLNSVSLSHASWPFIVMIRFVYPAFFRQSVISLLRSGESSATRIGDSQRSRSVILSISDTFSPVSGLISDTIFSKSRMMISSFPILMTPVEALFCSVLIVASGLMMDSHDTRWIPIT